MAQRPLFTDDPATDIGYCNVRAAGNDHARKARENCEQLWKMYEPYADPEFRVEFRNNFDARYWEMYLTTFLMGEGYAVRCPKPGPDVGIDFEGRRIWFEATSPTRGADDAPDQVPAQKVIALGEEPVMQDVPNEKMVLRYLNSISVKYKDQFAGWLEQKIVAPEDAFVIAINPRRLGHEIADTDPPRILQAAFTLGSPYIAIDRETSKAVGAGYQFRDTIKKALGAKVSTGVFHQSEYAGLSGLLCSRVDVVNQPEQMGTDFQLVPNPWAKVPLPQKLRLKGTYFRIEHTKDVYTAIPETV
jgi:hypothetical protein